MGKEIEKMSHQTTDDDRKTELESRIESLERHLGGIEDEIGTTWLGREATKLRGEIKHLRAIIAGSIPDDAP